MWRFINKNQGKNKHKMDKDVIEGTNEGDGGGGEWE